ncbi:MAG: fumarylacetoacetate hydrolase family protein [Deltaproteobacteria bacterium]|nr:fumarylacetoacetate hydrolase family protein [Deltaproteobacteria bacterium]MBW2140595.1 fumarylacetoacetate hydrolase family protein [Deltaproteobacteria bacterium]
MRLIRFKPKGETDVRVGVVENETVYEVAGDIFGPCEKTGRSFNQGQITLEAPCVPTKVVCLGLNYKDHAEEVNADLPEEPLIFLKPPSSIIGPGAPIIYPPQSKRVDYEAELAVVIGKKASHVSSAEALDYVLGYTCLNDVSARDFQQKDGQWTRAKGFDTFCPIGPAIETDLDPSDLTVEAWLNGERKQASSTVHLVFDVKCLIEHISGIMALLPGDIISTGTPSGVGPLEDGDEIEIRIQGIGGLINPVAR